MVDIRFKVLFCSCLMMFVFLGCSPNNNEEVSYNTWSPRNHNLLFEVKESKVSWENRVQVKGKFSAYIAQIVTPYNESKFITQWRFLYRDSILHGPITDINSLDGLGADVPGYKSFLNVDYSTEYGRYGEIENWDEITQYYNSAISKFEMDYVADSAGNLGMWEGVKEIFGRKEFLEHSITKHINAFHMFYNIPYSSDTTRFVMPLAGINRDTLVGEITSVILEETENMIGVLIAVHYQNESVSKNLIGVMEGLQKESLPGLSNFDLSLNDTCIAYYNKIAEYPYSVEYWRDVEMDTLYQRYHLSMVEKREEDLKNWRP